MEDCSPMSGEGHAVVVEEFIERGAELEARADEGERSKCLTLFFSEEIGKVKGDQCLPVCRNKSYR